MKTQDWLVQEHRFRAAVQKMYRDQQQELLAPMIALLAARDEGREHG